MAATKPGNTSPTGPAGTKPTGPAGTKPTTGTPPPAKPTTKDGLLAYLSAPLVYVAGCYRYLPMSAARPLPSG